MKEENEDDEQQYWEEVKALKEKFENYIQYNETYFFDADDYLMLIDYYRENKDFSMLAKILPIALEIYPDNPELKFYLAQYHFSNFQTEKALKIVNEIPFSVLTPDMLSFKAALYAADNKHEEAITLLKKLLKSHNEEYENEFDESDILLAMAESYQAIEDYENAEKCLIAAVHKDPEHIEALEALIDYFNFIGKLQETIEILEKIIDNNPYARNIWLGLAKIYAQIENYEKAIDTLEYAAAINDADGEPSFQLALVFVKMNDYERALTRVMEVFNNNKRINDTLGIIVSCFFYMDDWAGGERFFQRIIQENEDNDIKMLFYANFLINFEKYEEAKEVLRTFVVNNVANPSVFYMLGDIYGKLNDYDAAIEMYERSINIFPYPPCIIACFEAYMHAGRYDELLSFLDKNQEVMEFNAIYNVLKAVAEYYLDNKEEAIEYIIAALSEGVDFKEVTDRLSIEMGNDIDIIKAIDEFKKLNNI